MTIDLDEVGKSGVSLENILAILHVEATRIGKVLPYTSTKEEQILDMIEAGYLSSTTNGVRLTGTGRKLIMKIIDVKTTNKKDLKMNFDEFWTTFPASDKNGIWTRQRTLKSDKSRSKTLYERAITSGVTHEDLIRALKWDIKDRREKSVTSNRLTYMKATAAWLQQKEYEIILEELKTDVNLDLGDEDWSTSMV